MMFESTASAMPIAELLRRMEELVRLTEREGVAAIDQLESRCAEIRALRAEVSARIAAVRRALI